METTEKIFSGNDGGISIQDLWRVLKNGIVFLLIAAILCAGVAAAYAHWGISSSETASFAFWVSNLSTNYDYTSTAQISAGVAIAGQLVNLIKMDAPLRYIATEYDLAYKLGFLSEEDRDAVIVYRLAQETFAQTGTLLSEKEEALLSATEVKDNADIALALLEATDESGKTSAQKSIDLTKKDYDAVKSDVNTRTTRFANLAESIDTAYNNYVSDPADGTLNALKFAIQQMKEEMLLLAASYNTDNVTVNPASESIKIAKNKVDEMTTLLIAANREIIVAETVLEEAEAAYMAAPGEETLAAKTEAEEFLADLNTNKPAKEERVENAQAVYAFTLAMRDLYMAAQALNANASLKNEDTGAPDLVRAALESASLLLRVTAAMQETLDLSFEEWSAANLALYNAQKNVREKGRALTLAESEYEAAESAYTAASVAAQETDEVKALLLRNTEAIDNAVRYTKKTISGNQINADSLILRVKVTTSDIQKTMAICTAVQSYFPTYVKGLMKLRENENNTALVTLIDPVIDEKDVTHESAGTLRKYAIMGAMVGFVVCYGVLFVLDWRKKRIAALAASAERAENAGTGESLH